MLGLAKKINTVPAVKGKLFRQRTTTRYNKPIGSMSRQQGIHYVDRDLITGRFVKRYGK